MLRNACCAAVLCTLPGLQAQYADVRVGLRSMGEPRAVLVMGDQGPLDVWADGKRVAQLAAADGLVLRAGAHGITGKSLQLAVAAEKSVLLRSPLGRGFRLQTVDPKGSERVYPGVCELRLRQGRLEMVATVPLEDYVAGTVQSEAGKGQALEYYKLQAVSCRTYALANLRRHAGEGFQVCDGTHCQVFKGRNLQDTIRMAVEATRDLVAVDPEIRLIHATFHSNCGGETMNADELWSGTESYLVSTMDPYCRHAPHATWSARIPMARWLGWLHREYGVDTADANAVAILTDHEPECREIWLANYGALVPLERVRREFGLRSTWFGMHPEGQELVMQGRGFGHGVGLCQEGAMEMAREGLNYADILHHYFQGVHIVDLANLDFFRDADVKQGLLPRP
jgi:stage II sporulation protein D